MQPIKRFMRNLANLAGPEHCIFMFSDLRALLPELSEGAFKTLLSRAVKENHLERICRGLYLYPQVTPSGLLLFHAAARLRAGGFNYISLETVLSDAGVISQIPLNAITIMSSGRSNIISCGRYGSIEFVHTERRSEVLAPQLHYDSRCKLWRASVALAIRDMLTTHRNVDLIDWSIVNELI